MRPICGNCRLRHRDCVYSKRRAKPGKCLAASRHDSFRSDSFQFLLITIHAGPPKRIQANQQVTSRDRIVPNDSEDNQELASASSSNLWSLHDWALDFETPQPELPPVSASSLEIFSYTAFKTENVMLVILTMLPIVISNC